MGINLGPAPPVMTYKLVHEILLDAGIFSLSDPIPYPVFTKMPKMPIPRTIYGHDYVNVCSECGSTLTWDIRLINRDAPIRAMIMNWFRRSVLRRPPIGCLGAYPYGEGNCENYAGDKNV